MNALRVLIATSTLCCVSIAGAAEPAKTAPVEGKQVFSNWCAPCHTSGRFMPGTMALQARYQGAKPALLEQRTDLTPAIVKTFVRNGIGIMAPFRKTEVSDAQLEALAAYLGKSK